MLFRPLIWHDEVHFCVPSACDILLLAWCGESNRWLFLGVYLTNQLNCFFNPFVLADISNNVELFAFYSQHGIRGDIQITHLSKDEAELYNATATITVNLQTHMEIEPGQYNWVLYDLPVEYTQPTACDKGYLGDKYALLQKNTLDRKWCISFAEFWILLLHWDRWHYLPHLRQSSTPAFSTSLAQAHYGEEH